MSSLRDTLKYIIREIPRLIYLFLIFNFYFLSFFHMAEVKAPPEEEEEEEDWGSEESVGGEIPVDTSDEEYVLEEDEVKGATAKAKKALPNEKKGEQDGTSGGDKESTRKRKIEVSTVTEGKSAVPLEQEGGACSIAIQTPPLKLKKKCKIRSGNLTASSAVLPPVAISKSVMIPRNSVAAFSMAKTVIAVPPAVKSGTIHNAFTTRHLASGTAKPVSNLQVAVSTVQGSSAAAASEIIGLAPGTSNKVTTSAAPRTTVVLQRLIPANSSQTQVVIPLSALTSHATTVKATQSVPSINQEAGNTNTISAKSSTTAVPSQVVTPNVLAQQALGASTQVVIGGKVFTAVTVRGSSVIPGHQFRQVVNTAGSGAQQVSSTFQKGLPGTPTARHISVPATRPLILATSRGCQAPRVQPVTTTTSHNVLVSTVPSSTVQCSAPVLKCVSVPVSKPATLTAVSSSTGSLSVNSSANSSADITVAMPPTVPFTSQARTLVAADVLPRSGSLSSSLTNQSTLKQASSHSSAGLTLPVVPSLSTAGVQASVCPVSGARPSSLTQSAPKPASSQILTGSTVVVAPSLATAGAQAHVSTSGPTPTSLATQTILKPTSSQSSTVSAFSTIPPLKTTAAQGNVVSTSGPLPSSLATQPTSSQSSTVSAVSTMPPIKTTAAEANVVSTSGPLPSSLATQPIHKPTSSQSSTVSAISTIPSIKTTAAQANVVSTSGPLPSSLATQPVQKPTSSESSTVSAISTIPSIKTTGAQASAPVTSQTHGSVVDPVVTESRQPQITHPAESTVTPSSGKPIDVGQSITKNVVMKTSTMTVSGTCHNARITQSDSHDASPISPQVQGIIATSNMPSLPMGNPESHPSSTRMLDLSVNCTVQSQMQASGSATCINSNALGNSAQGTLVTVDAALCKTKVTDTQSTSLTSSVPQYSERQSTENSVHYDASNEEVTTASSTENKDSCAANEATSTTRTKDSCELNGATSKMQTSTPNTNVTVSTFEEAVTTRTTKGSLNTIDTSLYCKTPTLEGENIPTRMTQNSSSANDVSVKVTISEKDVLSQCNGVSVSHEQTSLTQEDMAEADQDEVALCNGSSTKAL